MKDINYALAPEGATDSYLHGWRMTDGVKWYSWTDLGWSPLVGPVMCHEYEPIPEREIALNRLADTLHHWDFNQNDFSRQEWQARLAERLEAGLIKQNKDLDHVNDTDVVEIEEKGTNRYGLDMGYFSNLMNREFASLSNYTPSEFARACARMAKTADESVLAEKEFAPEPSQEWINGIPPMGTKCEYRDELWYEDERFDECEFVGRRSNGELVVFGDNGYKEYSSKVVKFRPAKTDEQIAAEKRDEWIESVQESFDKTNGISIKCAIEHIYGALLDGSLEAPKGGDV